MKKLFFAMLICTTIISSMEKPLPKNKYLIDHKNTQECDEQSAWLRIPRITFMAMMLEAHSNGELDKQPFNDLLTKIRHRLIKFDEEEDAYCLTEKAFFSGLLAYVPWKGTAHDCVIPTRYNVIMHGIETQLTLGRNFWKPHNIKALAIEELSPGMRERLMHEYNSILKSVNFKE